MRLLTLLIPIFGLALAGCVVVPEPEPEPVPAVTKPKPVTTTVPKKKPPTFIGEGEDSGGGWGG